MAIHPGYLDILQSSKYDKLSQPSRSGALPHAPIRLRIANVEQASRLSFLSITGKMPVILSFDPTEFRGHRP